MAGGFKVADAFVEVGVDDSKVDSGLGRIKGKVAAGIAGLGLGALIGKGISENLDIKAGNAKLQGQLGLTKDIASKAGSISGQVYGDNFGGSLDDVNEAVRAVGTNLVDLGTTSPAQVKKLTESALGLADTFNVDVNEATRQASSLVKNGLAPDFQSAFDVITKGYQSGLNVAGDFGDTITEYSPQFHKLGIDGPMALQLLSNGLKAGARDTDTIADAFKEFSLRSIDGSALTAQGFKAAGLDAKTMAAEIAKGGPAAQKATMTTLQALLKIKDPVKQNQAGVALFGTQWEDTLRQILPAVAGTKQGMEGVKGSTDRMNAAVAAGANPVDVMKRRMEGWLTSATNLPGPLGQTSAAAAAMGSQSLLAAGALVQIGPAAGKIVGPVGSAAGAVTSGGARMVASAASTSASMIAASAVQIGRWIAQAAVATASAAAMAAAWLFSIWPIALIIAAVIGLTVLIIKNWGTIKAVTISVFNAVWGFLKSVWSNITGWISNTVSSISARVSGAWNSIRSFTSSVWNSITSFVSSIPGRMLSFFLHWTLAGVIISHFGSIKSGVVGKVNDLLGFVQSIPGRILRGLGNIGSLLWSAGSSIIQGLIDGITSKISNIKSTLSSVTNLIPDWKGPMDVDKELLEPSGQAIMGGLDKGLRRGVDTVKSTLRGVTSAIPDMLSGGPAVALPTGQVPGGGGAGTVNNYSIEKVEIRAEDLKELKDVTDFFEYLEQEARRLAPGSVSRG